MSLARRYLKDRLRRALLLLAVGWVFAFPLLTSVAILVGVSDQLPLAGWLALGGLWLTVVLLLQRWGWFPSLGPLFFYDVVRGSRRSEVAAHRCLYAVLLFLIMLVSYWWWFPDFDLLNPLRSFSLPNPQARAQFAGSFFAGLMALQFLVVLLLTPIYTAGAISEERERRSLEFLLVTELTDGEIVLGILGARLAKLMLLVLTGLPVVSLLPLLGGVAPSLVLTGYAVTAGIMLSVGSVSILMSVMAKSTLGAVVGTYLLMPLLLLITLSPCPGPVANPVLAVLFPFTPDDPTLPIPNREVGLLLFGIIQGLIAVICCWIAVSQLRGQQPDRLTPVAQAAAKVRLPVGPPVVKRKEKPDDWGPYPDAEETNPASRRRTLPHPPLPPRPPIGEDALLWKEMYVEKYIGSPDLEAPVSALKGLGLVFLIFLFVGSVLNQMATDTVGEGCQPVFKTVGFLVAGALLLVIAFSSTGRISRERERQTLETLLTLPVERGDILFAKWLGSLLSVRVLGWGLLVVWSLGFVLGGLALFAYLLLLATWMIYAGFLASLGLWLSSACHTTLRATLFTFLAALLFVANPLGVMDISLFNADPDLASDWPALVVEYVANPGSVLTTFSFREADLTVPVKSTATVNRILAAMAATQVYLAAIPLLWLATLARLRAEKGPTQEREEILSPGGPTE